MQVPEAIVSVARKSRLLFASLVICALGMAPAKAQEPVAIADIERVGRYFASDHSPDLLRCLIQPQKPRLDFAFRFDAGYIISCSLAKFEGRASEIFAYARVTPEGGKPVLLGDDYRLPAATEVRKSSQLKQNFEMSGGFAVGEGRYEVEVVVVDQATGRTSRKRWRAGVGHGPGARTAESAIPPHSVMPMGARPWPVKMDTSGKGLRLSVLLDAAPINPRTPALRAWDRAFLLGSLSSLLKEIPCASVRLRAFNLDQQRELFRQDQFDDSGLIALAASLRTTELGTVSYRVLQQQQGWLGLLLDYVNSELRAADPADAVIILGPRSRYFGDLPRGKPQGRETPNPHFFYFEYVPGRLPSSLYPDPLESLTRRLDGAVYYIFSPGDLAHSVQKMLTRVQPRMEPSNPAHWPARPAPNHQATTRH